MQAQEHATAGGHKTAPPRPVPDKYGIYPGSPVPIFRVLCDAGVISCDMEPGMEDTKTRLMLNILVYFARHKFDCPGLERYFYRWGISSKYSLMLESDLGSVTNLHSEPALEWDRKDEFVRFAQAHGHDVEWLEIASSICHAEDELRKKSMPVTREGVIAEACEWFIINRNRVPSVYDEMAKSPVGVGVQVQA